MNNRSRSILVIGLLAVLPCQVVRAQSTQPSVSGFELHEWTVFVLDASQNRLNPDGLIPSSAPEFVDSRRQASPKDAQNNPFPVGIIRLVGKADSRVDVRLQQASGKFLSYWPKAQTRASQLLWRDVALRDAPGTDPLRVVGPEHWFNSLREGNTDYLVTGEGTAERFLMFDVDMPYTCPVKVLRGNDHSVAVTNVGNSKLLQVRFYQPGNGLWRATTIGDLAAVKSDPKSATQPSTSRPTTLPTASSQPTTLPLATTQTTGPAATQEATTQPETSAHTFAATQSSPASATALAAEWTTALKQASVSDTDCQFITKIIVSQAFDARRLTVMYLMENAEYDRLLPLEVLPEPNKIVRLGIVIVKNADPEMGTEIDDLIAQLGNAAWSKREEASKALVKLGAAAIPKLEKASKNSDMEIVWRSEKLIAELRKGPPQPN